MLEVKTYIDKSTVPDAGLGCFAAEFIPKGARIWKLNPTIDKVFSDLNITLMSELEQTFIKTYCYRHNGLYFLCVDNARFFNHSDDPNTVDPCDEYSTYAARDINQGEEILSDYRSFGKSAEDLAFNTHFDY
jgi:hypothetical protein